MSLAPRVRRGQTGDSRGGRGRPRSAIDVYKVTLPPPPIPAAGAGADVRCAQQLHGTPKRDRLFGSIAGDEIRARAGKVNCGKGKDKVVDDGVLPACEKVKRR